MHSIVRRAAILFGATTATVALTSGSAFAHFCYIANESEQGAAGKGSSQVWEYIDIAAEFSGGDAEVTACITEGLTEAGLPTHITIMGKVPSPHSPALGSKNPHAAEKSTDGQGIDHLSEAMFGEVVGIAMGCGATPPPPPPG